jgi:sulfate transport system ATP-binding protein
MSIDVRSISKSFGAFKALDDVTLHVPRGELVALLGPSGSGKTTLLRVIAGLERPDRGPGTIHFDDEDVASRPARRRRVGFVFQHYALFRHMSVFENVAFGLRVKPRRERPTREVIQQRVTELLHLVQLGEYAGRYPSQLSGGQRQRVALARALAVEPRVLLLDEPFGALDARVRLELRRWLRRLHDEIHLTSVFVTHDQDEALEVADRVVVMNEGKVEQVGAPDEVFHRPASAFVMNFLGRVNSFHGRAEGRLVEFASIRLEAPQEGPGPSGPVRVFVRPHELEIGREPNHKPSLPATVRRVHAAGATVQIELLADTGETVVADVPQERFRELAVQAGDRIFVTPTRVRVF